MREALDDAYEAYEVAHMDALGSTPTTARGISYAF